MENIKYIFEESIHNLDAPNEIVPIIMDLINPKSVIDIGCGIGTFLYCFKKFGTKKILGVDGKWVNKSLLDKYLSPDEFLEFDIECPFEINEKFDLVVSLEVAEHLCAESADIFINNLISCGNVVLFSAAIPLQGGQNHVNEQWLDYWEEKFNNYNFVVHDVLKPLLWNNPKVFCWYKQNMVIFAHKDFILSKKELKYNYLDKVVHYDLFLMNSIALRNARKQIEEQNKIIDRLTTK